VNSKNAISGDTIIELASWLIAEEKRAASTQSRPGKFPHHWLFRATFLDLDRKTMDGHRREVGGIQRQQHIR